jgi:hypothetical protein
MLAQGKRIASPWVTRTPNRFCSLSPSGERVGVRGQARELGALTPGNGGLQRSRKARNAQADKILIRRLVKLGRTSWVA